MDFDNPKVYGDTFISDGLVTLALHQPHTGGLYLAALVLCSTPETPNEPLVPGCGASK